MVGQQTPLGAPAASSVHVLSTLSIGSFGDLFGNNGGVFRLHSLGKLSMMHF